MIALLTVGSLFGYMAVAAGVFATSWVAFEGRDEDLNGLASGILGALWPFTVCFLLAYMVIKPRSKDIMTRSQAKEVSYMRAKNDEAERELKLLKQTEQAYKALS